MRYAVEYYGRTTGTSLVAGTYWRRTNALARAQRFANIVHERHVLGARVRDRLTRRVQTVERSAPANSTPTR